VLTVPLSILQRDLISFTPPLPDAKVSALNRLQLGVTNKIVRCGESISA
jgi:monoamine oxidase